MWTVVLKEWLRLVLIDGRGDQGRQLSVEGKSGGTCEEWIRQAWGKERWEVMDQLTW